MAIETGLPEVPHYDLASPPAWIDLGHGVRLHLAPLTTALMVAARSDPAFAALGEGTPDETRPRLRQGDRPG